MGAPFKLKARGHEIWQADLQHQADETYVRADAASHRQLERVFEPHYDRAAEFGRINGEAALHQKFP